MRWSGAISSPEYRVLTEKDLERYELYPFFALGTGLKGNKESRQYAATHFSKIAHPEIKLGWAITFFREGNGPPEVVPYLRKAFDTLPESGFGLGPEFEDFKERVFRASESGKLMRVESVKQHMINAFPKYGDGQDYRSRDFVFAPGGAIYGGWGGLPEIGCHGLWYSTAMLSRHVMRKLDPPAATHGSIFRGL